MRDLVTDVRGGSSSLTLQESQVERREHQRYSDVHHQLVR